MSDDETIAPVPGAELADLREEVQKLIADVGRPVRRVSLRAGESVIELEWEPEATPTVAAPVPATAAPAPVAAAPAAAATPAPEAAAPAAAPAPAGHAVVAPLVGAFYSAPSPGADPFVKVGDTVRKGQQVGIVEAMKLMNAVLADRAGTVVSIEVADGDMVEFGQPLVVLSADEPEQG